MSACGTCLGRTEESDVYGGLERVGMLESGQTAVRARLFGRRRREVQHETAGRQRFRAHVGVRVARVEHVAARVLPPHLRKQVRLRPEPLARDRQRGTRRPTDRALRRHAQTETRLRGGEREQRERARGREHAHLLKALNNGFVGRKAKKRAKTALIGRAPIGSALLTNTVT